MTCAIQPPSDILYKYHHEAYFSDTKGDNFFSKRNQYNLPYSSSDSEISELPLMTPPSLTSMDTHLNPNFHLFYTSSLSSQFLQPILNANFLKSSKENYIQPIYDAKFRQVILPVECGRNHAFMYLNRLCQGSKGPCILFKSCYWLTPNEFQYISGRETAKDWKRSIRHNGKSIKLLINKGIICVHSPLCECGTATSSSVKVGKLLRPIQEECLKNMEYSDFSEVEDVAENRVSTTVDLTNNDEGFQRFGAKWKNSSGQSKSGTSVGDLDSLGTEGSSPRSVDWNFPSTSGVSTSTSTTTSNSLDEFRQELNENEDIPGVERERPVSSSLGNSPFNTAAESQSEEPSLTGSAQSMNNNNNDSPTLPVKSKRKNKQSALKSERQSPQLSSSTSPPMTPPPPTISGSLGNSSGSSPPPPPIKQMEQMMSSSARNYSDFMRSLAAKYNQQQPAITSEYYSRASPAANFAFDTRFLKPAAAAALLNLSCSQIPQSLFGEKDKFPMIDMSSTQTLLSMVRSASAAAANNLESLKTNSQNKRPNSPLDLSSRDMPSTPPPLKKSKLRNPLLDVTLKAAAATMPCLSSCSTGCTEEAQTMINWSVEDVCRFVATIDLCKEYVEVFREHSIDGSSLPLLTEEHLMNAMNMKLGPALKFRSTVARKLGTCVVCSHCTHCHSHNNANNVHSP